MNQALKEIIEQIKTQQISSQKALNHLKRDIAKKYRLPNIPTNSFSTFTISQAFVPTLVRTNVEVI
ncbi:hypothetical protein CL620_03195 [archaeon]|nr:hypothetical protein [archaeon]